VIIIIELRYCRISDVARNLLMGGQTGGLEGGTPQRGPATEPRWGSGGSPQKLETNVHIDFENKQIYRGKIAQIWLTIATFASLVIFRTTMGGHAPMSPVWLCPCAGCSRIVMLNKIAHKNAGKQRKPSDLIPIHMGIPWESQSSPFPCTPLVRS